MKQLIFIIFLLLGNVFAAVENDHANNDQISPNDIYDIFSPEESNKSDGMLALATGIPLTLAGVASFIAYKDNKNSDEPNIAVLGIPLALIGIPMIIYGIYCFFPKKKTQSAHFIIAPSIDVLRPQAGLDMHVRF